MNGTQHAHDHFSALLCYCLPLFLQLLHLLFLKYFFYFNSFVHTVYYICHCNMVPWRNFSLKRFIVFYREMFRRRFIQDKMAIDGELQFGTVARMSDITLQEAHPMGIDDDLVDDDFGMITPEQRRIL